MIKIHTVKCLYEECDCKIIECPIDKCSGKLHLSKNIFIGLHYPNNLSRDNIKSHDFYYFNNLKCLCCNKNIIKVYNEYRGYYYNSQYCTDCKIIFKVITENDDFTMVKKEYKTVKL